MHCDAINLCKASYTPIIAATLSMTGRLLLDICLIYLCITLTWIKKEISEVLKIEDRKTSQKPSV